MRIEALNGALHQWDTGRQIEVICDEGCTLDYVEFSHHRSPSPIRVAPDAGNAVSIPDELLRHSGMLMVSAIVIDARGKDFAHSACLCTEAAVRPAGYSGGGSGGGDIKVKQIPKVLFEQENLTFNEQDGYWEFIIPDAPFYFATGKTYIVTFAGEEYRLDAVYKGSDYIGNLSIFSSTLADTGEPFAMRNSGSELCIRTTLPGGVYDVTIVDPSEKESELVFSGSGISNVAHCTYDASTNTTTAYLGDYPNGNYFELTNKMAKKMIDHYGYISTRFYENGSQVAASIVAGYEMTDGGIEIYW